jgi:hypothetical protein
VKDAARRIEICEYLLYRAQTRGYDVDRIKEILRYGEEWYIDIDTGRRIAIGRHDPRRLVLIAFEATDEVMRPVTVHATTRQQITFRIRTGRYVHE